MPGRGINMMMKHGEYADTAGEKKDGGITIFKKGILLRAIHVSKNLRSN